jgi:hypothetical protein
MSEGGLLISPVRSARQRREFLDLPYRLHRKSGQWIAPLRMAQKDLFNTRKHPFYKTSEVEMFLAYRNGRAVGRIMVILNKPYSEFHGQKTGFFGFFEAENDQPAAAGLIEAAAAWLRQRGAESMQGPVNPSTNYECGLLVEGFDQQPAVMMPYNPPYYGTLLESSGLKKAMDLYAFYVDEESFVVSEKVTRIAERVRQREGITVRNVDMKQFDREVEFVRRVYNDAWSLNWGFVPVSPEEFDHLAKDLKQIADPALVYIAEKHEPGRAEPVPIGFFLAVPDLNRALRKLKGRLLPTGIFKLLWHSRRIDAIRVITMGVIKEHQNLGIAAVFYDEVYRRGRAKGYRSAEMSWVLENNTLMVRAAELLGGRRSKTYRIYEMGV